MAFDERICFLPDTEHPGWMLWSMRDPGRFNEVVGPLRVRSEGEGRARCRLFIQPHHSNLNDVIHGAALLSLIDTGVFAASHVIHLQEDPQYRGRDAVTLDMSVQFLAPGKMDQSIDMTAELLKETGRLLFVRGVLEQGDHKVASYSATLRKIER